MARRLVADVLGAYPSGLVDDALVLASELVTNAVRHGRADIELRIRADNDTVRVEVSDASPEPPRLVPAQTLTETGRGLLILAAIATAWGTEPRPDGTGKTVWFELASR
jgi:anti-sigma regulatory factor (Ser/Thr protein kinase)